MRVENRSDIDITGGGPRIICICENEAEAKLVDLLGKPGTNVEGKLDLADGYGQFYISLKPKKGSE